MRLPLLTFSLLLAYDSDDLRLFRTAMVSYPTGLTQVAEESNTPTPTHGGVVQTGNEYDIFISQKLTNNPSPSPAPPTALPQRRTTTSSQRARPMSMPPQAYGQSPTTPAPAERERTTKDDSATKRNGSKDQSRSRSSNRILGDYTLSKTLGAGSMGKVKLAHHSITDETVSYSWIHCIMTN